MILDSNNTKYIGMRYFIYMTKEKILTYACRYTDFYKEKFSGFSDNCNWLDLPIVSKSEILHAGISIISNLYYKEFYNNNLMNDYTSGTTGECLEIYTTRAEEVAKLLSLWKYRKKYYGINTSDKFCYFYTYHSNVQDSNWDYNERSLGISKEYLLQEHLEEIYLKIYQFNPKWLLLQPSIAMILSRYIFEFGVDIIPSLQYIELTGEFFTAEQKKFISSAFEVPVASQYGSNEIGTIAYECPCGNMHIMENNVHVDIMPVKEKDKTDYTNGKYGHLIITAKNNKVMPFVRYDIGDIGRLRNVNCNCGHDTPIIELYGARKDDMIQLKGGGQLSANVFRKIFRQVMNVIDGTIFQYQVIQKNIDDFLIMLATDEDKICVENAIYFFLNQTILKHAKLKFEFYMYIIPDKKIGKHRFFVNEKV